MAEEDDQGWSTVKRKNRQGRGSNQFRFDIATDRNFKKDNFKDLVTFFFTKFPERYGAKAVFNAFHNYGDIMEVVIPAKRDRGGRRFSFARFARVEDVGKLESEPDKIIFGSAKISVNLSRFHRPDETNCGPVRNEERKEQQVTNFAHHHRSRSLTRAIRDRSLSRVVRSGAGQKQGGVLKKVVMSYEAEKNDLQRFQKAFVGEGGAVKKDNLGEGVGKGAGQKVGSFGPAISTNSHHIVKGGAVRRISKSEVVGLSIKPLLSQHVDSEGKRGLKGGVYSDGPRHVYNFLNSGPRATKTPKKQHGVSKSKGQALLNTILPSASLRKQQHMLRSLNTRNSNSVSNTSISCPRRERGGTVGASKSGPSDASNCVVEYSGGVHS
ncbi:hypothetical protein P8452_02175 [Trifolium repens]|nr:hypothetical protein P8452_02175 [Trifolium repens]